MHYLFLIYSLLPGFFKISDNQLWMLLNLPILIYLVLKGRNHLYKIDLLFLLYLLSICVQTILWFKMDVTNKMGLLTGFYLSVLPMVGYLFSRKLSFKEFANIIMFVAFFHAIIGILLYPLFDFNVIPESFSSKLLLGVMAGRMSSVSGSLGFGSMLMVASICAFYYNKKILFLFFFVCVILSLQRSAWLAVVLAIVLYSWYLIKKGDFRFFIRLSCAVMLVMCVCFFFFEQYASDLTLLSDKLSDIGSATGERSQLWADGVVNFLNYPLGTGVGQVGQVARFEPTSFLMVSDGDYFRILSEFGLLSIFFYIAVFLSFFLLVMKCAKLNKEKLCLVALVGGFSLQMLGSNITEFYYNSFIYWVVLGYFFLLIKEYIIRLK